MRALKSIQRALTIAAITQACFGAFLIGSAVLNIAEAHRCALNARGLRDG